MYVWGWEGGGVGGVGGSAAVLFETALLSGHFTLCLCMRVRVGECVIGRGGGGGGGGGAVQQSSLKQPL